MRTLSIFILCFLFLQTFSQETSQLHRLYSGGEIHLIAPEMISTQLGEYSPFYNTRHNELFFMRRTPGKFDYTIYSSKLTSQGWSNPKVVSFSGTYRDAAPYLSPDGNTMYFDSRRPSEKIKKSSINIWYATRTKSGWNEPKLVAASINANDEPEVGQDEFGPATDNSGTLYFYSFRQPYRGGAHYSVTFLNEQNPTVEKKLPDPSFPTFVAYMYIAPNGKFLLLEGGEKGRSDTDIYYACKQSDSNWTMPKRVEKINTRYGEGVPSMTADGKFLLFASDRKSKNENVSNANLYIVKTNNLFGKCRKQLFE